MDVNEITHEIAAELAKNLNPIREEIYTMKESLKESTKDTDRQQEANEKRTGQDFRNALIKTGAIAPETEEEHRLYKKSRGHKYQGTHQLSRK